MSDFKTYANSFQEKSRLGLESIGMLTQKLGNPQKNMKFIHVAGTNGKGSVCAFLQCILSDSGLKTGKFISPNMIDVCERISVDGKDITHKELNLILDDVRKAAEEVKKEMGVMPTQFEIWTAAAFVYFSKRKCDIVVLETGLGGRLDATNIIESPLCSVITKIDVDHIEYLGGTIPLIAAEKAGIIKENCPVITAAQSKEAEAVLKEAAHKKNAPLTICGKTRAHSHKGMTEIFDYKEMNSLEINLSGIHQTENATLAVETALLLNIEEKHIRSGLSRAVNPGRFEKISEKPTIIFDGAHNISATKTLIKAIERYFPENKISFIYGAMADKDISSSAELLQKSGFCGKSKVFSVNVKDNPRSATAEALAEIFRGKGFDSYACKSIEEAVSLADEESIIIICGSLYLYKDLTDIILNKLHSTT